MDTDNIIFVDSQFHLEQLDKCYAAQSIAEKGVVKDIPIVRGDMYVITGGGTFGDGTCRTKQVWGYRVCKLEEYTGNAEPLTYNDHRYAVAHEGRDRGYNGMLVKWGNELMILFGEEYTFKYQEKQSIL